jgi:hypothetical protein
VINSFEIYWIIPSNAGNSLLSMFRPSKRDWHICWNATTGHSSEKIEKPYQAEDGPAGVASNALNIRVPSVFTGIVIRAQDSEWNALKCIEVRLG